MGRKVPKGPFIIPGKGMTANGDLIGDPNLLEVNPNYVAKFDSTAPLISSFIFF